MAAVSPKSGGTRTQQIQIALAREVESVAGAAGNAAINRFELGTAQRTAELLDNLSVHVHRIHGMVLMRHYLLTALIVFGASAQQTSGFHAPWVSCFAAAGQFSGPKNVRTEIVTS